MKKLFFFTLAGVAAILSSCTKTETVEIPDSRAINFSGAYIGNAVETRAQQNPGNITDASITEFIVYGGYNGTMTDVFNGELVTGTSGGSWTYTNTEYWVNGKTYDFAAYAPAAVSSVATVAADDANKALSFTDFTSNASSQNDLLYAHETVPTVNPSTQGEVTFNFDHALSKIHFTFTNAIDGKLTIEGFKFYGMNSQGDYTYNTSAMEWGNIDTPIEGTAPFTATVSEIAAVGGTATAGDFLVIPQNVTASAMTVTFIATLTNNSGDEIISDYEVTATLPAGEWVSGQCYNYNLNITMEVLDPDDKLKPIVFGDPTVTGWPDEAHDEDQDIELTQPGN